MIATVINVQDHRDSWIVDFQGDQIQIFKSNFICPNVNDTIQYYYEDGWYWSYPK